MSDAVATVIWQRNDEGFLHPGLHRTPAPEFDGGAKIDGSAAPPIVPGEAEPGALQQQAHQQCFIANSLKPVVAIKTQRWPWNRG